MAIAEWGRTLRDILFPEFCKRCGERLHDGDNGYFCPACWESSPRIARPFCTQCGRPHYGLAGYGMPNNFPCADCRANPNPDVRRVYGAAQYADAVEQAVKLFKFNGRMRLAQPLGALAAEFAEDELGLDSYDRVVPVPLHPVRERERGFNQSLLLAREIAPVFTNAVLNTRLTRIRPTQTQSKLSPEARRKNVRGAFAVVGEDLVRARVLLIDDVVTTGETIMECARALRRAGAETVDTLAVALSVPNRPTL